MNEIEDSFRIFWNILTCSEDSSKESKLSQQWDVEWYYRMTKILHNLFAHDASCMQYEDEWLQHCDRDVGERFWHLAWANFDVL